MSSLKANGEDDYSYDSLDTTDIEDDYDCVDVIDMDRLTIPDVDHHDFDACDTPEITDTYDMLEIINTHHMRETSTSFHLLDLVFIIDCTVSMELYMQEAIDKIHQIIHAVKSERIIDTRFALIEYRDHPPQEHTFITRIYNFTNVMEEVLHQLRQCHARGGGDGPEAIADALNDALNLKWRFDANKICVCISDAPPHGLDPSVGDGFPDGCPCGLDSIVIAGQMSRRNIILHTVGVEPSLERYRPYFQTLALRARGEYVSLTNAQSLGQIIINEVCEFPTQQ